MSSFDFELKTADQIKQELDEASEAQSEDAYYERLLEEHKKILESQLTLEYKKKYNCSLSEAKCYAIADERYLKHINGLVEAEKKHSKSKSKYANLQSYLKYLISWITTQRDLGR